MSTAHSSASYTSLPTAKGHGPVLGLLLLAAVSAAAVVAGWISGDPWAADQRRLAFSYLTCLMFMTTISIGSLAWLMLQHLTGAVWSVVIRRVMENLTRPLPLIAALAVPVAFSLRLLYPWADPSRVATDPGLARRAAWLNPLLFNVRSTVYLVSWALCAGILGLSSARQDRTGDPALSRRMRRTSAVGLVVLAATSSFAAFDWLMSLDPHWSSTIFGVYFWVSSLLGSLAALVLAVLGFRAVGWLGETVTVEHLHDLGKLLFAFVMFWAYIAFCQYFLIWYANFPEETAWYVTRRSGIWNTLSWSLVLGHFAVPFILLLFRATKRSPAWLGFSAAWILSFHYIDLYWLIMPALRPDAVEPHWLDVSLLLALVFTCGAIVTRAGQSTSLIPIGDPRLAESLAFRNS
jgi:hypothetical protein